jgi:hypothetical protein
VPAAEWAGVAAGVVEGPPAGFGVSSLQPPEKSNTDTTAVEKSIRFM